MGALTARRGWIRGVLSISTILVLFLASWAVWNFLQAVEYDAAEACVLVETPEGEVVQLDPELCRAGEDGSIKTLQQTSWIMFAVFWVAPLFALYFLRKRFQPDDVRAGDTAHIAEVAGWLLLTFGGLALVGAFFLPNFGVGEALWSTFLVGVPTVSGVLLIRWGRRRRAPTPDTASE